ncbi:hypothetical protein QYS36_05280 [Pseudomonas sp. G34]|uniref:hypothetical protein n=1 Tax=Pseudomonas sp. G34 TaxID=3059083 RepID=UPI0028067924|nr:hypothetical protein [Pseudomonas sp. G34]MDQ7984353.1 hypothetical protein [Pseudomonas sp. G34]
MNPSPLSALALVAVIGLTLAGCEMAEESAQKFTEKAEQAVQEIAREAVSDTVTAFNKQIDEVQKSTNEMLGKPEKEGAKEETEQAQPEPEHEQPRTPGMGGVET